MYLIPLQTIFSLRFLQFNQPVFNKSCLDQPVSDTFEKATYSTMNFNKNAVEYNKNQRMKDWFIYSFTAFCDAFLQKRLDMSVAELWYSGQCAYLRGSYRHWWWISLLVLQIENLDADIIVQ
jgi:hypothetical protein